jgi:peptide/nickel transport system ATP-binding protein
MSPREALLSVGHLSVLFGTAGSSLRAVDDVSFTIAPRETLAIVGESGCGKSVTAMSLLRLLPANASRIMGSIQFGGQELLGLREAQMRAIRGNEISMIFQEPMTSLNPVLTVGRQIAETLALHQQLSRSAALAQAAEMLDRVRIPDAQRRLSEYPHQLSGGMRQRVMIAMALACKPQLLIADEPTTALDVTMQAQILALMRELRESTGTAVLLITHDLGVVAEMAERVLVMYAGRIVEQAPVDRIFDAPAHPYTRGLLDALPRLGSSVAADVRARLNEIPGVVPALSTRITGCPFAPRCAAASTRCHSETPALHAMSPDHAVACHHPIGSPR